MVSSKPIGSYMLTIKHKQLLSYKQKSNLLLNIRVKQLTTRRNCKRVYTNHKNMFFKQSITSNQETKIFYQKIKKLKYRYVCHAKLHGLEVGIVVYVCYKYLKLFFVLFLPLPFSYLCEWPWNTKEKGKKVADLCQHWEEKKLKGKSCYGSSCYPISHQNLMSCCLQRSNSGTI